MKKINKTERKIFLGNTDYKRACLKCKLESRLLEPAVVRYTGKTASKVSVPIHISKPIPGR